MAHLLWRSSAVAWSWGGHIQLKKTIPICTAISLLHIQYNIYIYARVKLTIIAAYKAINKSINLFLYLFVCLSFCLFICLSVHLFLCLFVHLCISMSISLCPFISSISLSLSVYCISVSIYQYIYRSIESVRFAFILFASPFYILSIQVSFSTSTLGPSAGPSSWRWRWPAEMRPLGFEARLPGPFSAWQPWVNVTIWRFPYLGVPQNGWLRRQNPI